MSTPEARSRRADRDHWLGTGLTAGTGLVHHSLFATGVPFLVAPLGFFLASASSTRWSRGSLVGLLLALLLAETDISALELLDDLGGGADQ